jgi:5-methylcytosine-specific restriction endonuclease McrA
MAAARRLLRRVGQPAYGRVRVRLARDAGWLCWYCGEEVWVGFNAHWSLATIDHRLPLSRGGTWKRRNLVCACKRCNMDKGDLTEVEYVEFRRGMGLWLHPRWLCEAMPRY